MMTMHLIFCVFPYRNTIKPLTTDSWSSPFDTGSGLITGCCVRRYSRAETLTISTCIAGTSVCHAGFKIAFWIHLFERNHCEERAGLHFTHY